MAKKKDDETVKKVMTLIAEHIEEIAKENDFEYIIGLADLKSKLAIIFQNIDSNYFPSLMAKFIIQRAELENVSIKSLLKKIKICIEVLKKVGV